MDERYLLYNGYPSLFIEKEFEKFFPQSTTKSPFLSFIQDEKQFFQMRQHLLGQPTLRQSQVALIAATADIDNAQTDDQHIEIDPKTNKRPKNNAYKLYVHYKHEHRFQSFKRDMHKLYEDVFRNTPAIHVKIVVGNRNRRDAKHELIRKRLKKRLLRNIMTQKQRNKKAKRLSRAQHNNPPT